MRKAVLLASMLALGDACGGGGGSPTAPASTLPPTPVATIQAAGNGVLRIHPSVNQTFSFALETPLRIAETGGGTVDWNFGRLSLFRSGVEIERSEVGADTIRQAGFSRINPRATVTPTVLFRINAMNFDRVDIVLGFGDLRDGRQFTTNVNGDSFSGVDVSVIPMLIPEAGAVR